MPMDNSESHDSVQIGISKFWLSANETNNSEPPKEVGFSANENIDSEPVKEENVAQKVERWKKSKKIQEQMLE